MADLPTVTVTGQPLPDFDPFTLDLLPYFATDNSVTQYREWTPEELGTQPAPAAPAEPEEAFAPPIPPPPVKLLPEVIVEAPTIFGTILTGLTALLFPQPMGPREFDEAPGGGGSPPPPDTPVGEDPIMPPNWWDLVSEPFPTSKPGLPLIPVPVPPVEMPPGEKYFDVSPPRPSTRPAPAFPVDNFWLEPINPIIEVPFAAPDFGADPGPGSAPTPTSTPRSDPVPGVPDLWAFPWPDVGFEPTSTPAPDVPGFAPPDLIGDPIGDPILTSPLPPPSSKRPDPTTGPEDPSDFFDTTLEPILTEFSPNPLKPEADTCQCDKKKPKKKRKPREKCYRGTYIQRAKGTVFRPTEEVPCDAPLPKKVSKRETDPFGRPVPTKKRKKKTDRWKDVLDQVFPKP